MNKTKYILEDRKIHRLKKLKKGEYIKIFQNIMSLVTDATSKTKPTEYIYRN